MFYIVTQLRDILTLVGFITDNQLPIADRRSRGARRITVIISAYQRVGCQITQHLHANRPTSADTDTAVRGLKLRSILDIDKAEPATPLALRHLKVGYVSRRHADRHDMTRYYSRCPSLHLTGSWLESAGFGMDTAVTVTVEHGQLLIRIVTE
ncbi:type I toxin-antitoxin system SymE family toxin [Pectobacterium polaris]|nr:type I toxin-antitoxin system SymE family toxin [Pectobacterium polaris]PWD63205.1 hypothetical protein DF209_00890 [Pectobacterium polaris]